MRTFAAAALLSIAAHAIAVAVVPTRVPPVVRPRVALPPAPPEAAPAEPIEVVLLDDAPAVSGGVGVATVAVAAHATRGIQVAAIATGASHAGGSGETPAAPDRPRSPLMVMRTHPDVTGVSGDFMARFLESSRPLVRGPDVAGEQVRADLAGLDARLRDRDHVANADPGTIANERLARDAKARELETVELKPAGNGTFESDQGPYTAKVARDGTVAFHDARNLQLDSPFGGHFDVTDAIMRGHGNDPYASAKRAFLDRTREQRAELGRRDRTDKLHQAPAYMQQHLDRLWATVADPAERKRTLFELWDECAETGDVELVAAAAGARQLLVGFIHARHVVYTPAELAALNAHRQSTAAFAP